jgi:hypothetical protein
MGGRVPHWDKSEIPLLDHYISRAVDHDAPERKVAFLPSPSSDLERSPQVVRIGLAQPGHGIILSILPVEPKRVALPGEAASFASVELCPDF